MTFFRTVKAKNQPLEKFARKKFDRILVCGGDGTVAQVVSFLAENNIDTPLVIVPQGSANILARSLGIPVVMAKHALEYGFKHRGRHIDIIKINNSFHALVAIGCGYDALIMQKTPRSLKVRLGFLAYVWTVIKTFLFYKSKRYKLTIDGKRYQVMAKSIMVLNVLPLVNKKMMKKYLKSHISPVDGRLNIYVINPRSILDILNIFKPKIHVFKGKNIVIKSRKERKFQIDGEFLKCKTLNISVMPKAVKIVFTKKFK